MRLRVNNQGGVSELVGSCIWGVFLMLMLVLIKSASAVRISGSSFDISQIVLSIFGSMWNFLQLAAAVFNSLSLMELSFVHEVMK